MACTRCRDNEAFFPKAGKLKAAKPKTARLEAVRSGQRFLREYSTEAIAMFAVIVGGVAGAALEGWLGSFTGMFLGGCLGGIVEMMLRDEPTVKS